jgi:hypothetical protein
MSGVWRAHQPGLSESFLLFSTVKAFYKDSMACSSKRLEVYVVSSRIGCMIGRILLCNSSMGCETIHDVQFEHYVKFVMVFNNKPEISKRCRGLRNAVNENRAKP